MEEQHTYTVFDFVMHLLMLRFQNEHSQSSQIIFFIFLSSFLEPNTGIEFIMRKKVKLRLHNHFQQ
jgi:hypothetical protein